MLQKILNYWYNIEFFNPCWPVNNKEDTDLTKKDLPWQLPQNDPKIQVSYDVYIGKAISNDLITWMLEELNINKGKESIERDYSATCLCALKVDEDGKYVAKSFSISSFAWAICKLVDDGSIAAELDISYLNNLQQQINNSLLPTDDEDDDSPLSKYSLYNIFNNVCRKIKIKDRLFLPTLWSHKKVQYANKNGEFPPLDPSTELMPSFYLKDLETIQKHPTKKIANYAQAMTNSDIKMEYVHIDKDVKKMQYYLAAERYPLGMWPSEFSPSLMQQIGINIATSNNQQIFSVNGPPGTGKTTLLKEIVVSNIIKRANVMTKYSSPDDAFEKTNYDNSPGMHDKIFYKLDSKLSEYGMIVASNNNTAVENISSELPKMIEKDRTGHFSVYDSTDNTYFSDVASNLLGESAWGLISAKLGKRKHIKQFAEDIWWSKDKITLKHYYDEGIRPNWNTARNNFNEALQKVLDIQSEIKYAQSLLLKKEQAKNKQSNAETIYNENHKEYLLQKKILSDNNQKLQSMEKKLLSYKENVELLKSNLNFIKRTFWQIFKNNSTIKEWKKNEEDIADTTIEITRKRKDIFKQEVLVQNIESQNKVYFENLSKTTYKLQLVEDEISKYKVRFGENWADDDFWENICKNKSSQIACPWTYEEYDKLREELFYQALMLHKAFILSSNCIEHNLKQLFLLLWNDKLSINDRKLAYGNLLNTLLLVVPVISTTFASVQKFLDGIQAEELGLLIIDEAGQATPQSALGALWRTKKAIIVGDPLQVEPIVTTPKELRKIFAQKNKIPCVYRSSELSVQILADKLNPYGGYRTVNDKDMWLGCPLVVHRRCLNPMFDISNEIAYNNRMFYQTEDPDKSKNFLLPQSTWFDIQGTEKGNKDHSVQQQINFTVKLVEQAIKIYGEFPDLYVITPFTTINTTLKNALKPLFNKKSQQVNSDENEKKDWLKSNCGTIHTFQGKEANEVLLVLGCDKTSGINAAKWVGSKPNIINVAVSRAKYRLGVIGDYSLWNGIHNVSEVCKAIKDTSIIPITK